MLFISEIAALFFKTVPTQEYQIFRGWELSEGLENFWKLLENGKHGLLKYSFQIMSTIAMVFFHK